MQQIVQSDLFVKAKTFLEQCYCEMKWDNLDQRIALVEEQISKEGTYTHTPEELEFGARVAWRNSNRCVGRLFWKTLRVRDKRDLSEPNEIYEDLAEHIAFAFNGGKIRSAISVYRPMHPDDSHPLRVWNPQLFRYAGYRQKGAHILGDPAMVEFTDFCQKMGWQGKRTAFDLLPFVISGLDGIPKMFHPSGQVPEVSLRHPEFPWFQELGLKWYALPVIANMILEIGGIRYTAAPFNGWYMLTEIGTRNLADEKRYNLLPTIADKLGLEVSASSYLWKDKALLVLNEAVWHSFREAGVTLIDHHQAAEQFLRFTERETGEGREVTAEWSWIVPPTAGSTLEVFHQDWPNTVKSPNFFYADHFLGEALTPDQIPLRDKAFYLPLEWDS